MTFEFRTQVAAGHPAFAGHFPDHPVVPGVLLLDEVLRATEAWLGKVNLVAIPTVKFLRVLSPAEAFTVRLSDLGAGEIAFTCDCGGETVSTGRLRLASVRDPA